MNVCVYLFSFIYIPDKSRYFATTEINIFFYHLITILLINHSLTARGTDLSFLHKSVVSITHEQNIIFGKTLICRQLFEGRVGVLSVNEKEGKAYPMIVTQLEPASISCGWCVSIIC